MENFKHRVGIRKGKYIGRDHWQEGSESDFDDPNSQRFQEQRANWSNKSHNSNSKDSWDLSLMGSTSPLKETDSIQQLTIAESSGKQQQQQQQLGFPSEELNTAHSSPQVTDARPGSRHENNLIESVTRKTRSRTLAETREATATSASAPITALPNSLNSSASSSSSLSSSTMESRAVTSPSVPAIQMDATLLLRPHDTSHSITDEDSESRRPNSAIGRHSESRGASETLSGAALNSIGSQQGFMTNQRGDGCLIQGQESC